MKGLLNSSSPLAGLAQCLSFSTRHTQSTSACEHLSIQVSRFRAIERFLLTGAQNNTDPSILFIADVVNRRSTLPILDQLQTLQRSLQRVVLVRWDEVPIRSEITWDHVLQGASSVSTERLEKIQASVDINAVVNFQFTSGTTGSPKATMLSHLWVSGLPLPTGYRESAANPL